MKNYQYILCLFCLITSYTYSQGISHIEHEVGIQAGIANYYGDLNNSFDYKGIGSAGTIFLRQNFGSRFALKTSASIMHVHYKDEYSSDLFQKQRNLSFKTNITDITTQIEFNFLEFVKSVYYTKNGVPFTPYLSFGLGVFFFNPQAEYQGKTYNLQPLGTEGQTDPDYTGKTKYGLFNFTLVYGAGFKYHLGKNLSVGLDFNIRRTFSDYIDDVSGNYPQVISLPEADKGISYMLYDRSKELGPSIGLPGKQRGTLDGNDDYATFMLNISWTFIKPFCPRDGGS